MLPRLVTLLLLVFPLTAFAQSEVGGATLNGTVTDPSSAVIAGAIVKLSSSQTGLSRSVNTNESGVYSFLRVPVGAYILTIDHPGFRSTRIENVTLDIGAVATLDFQLTVGPSTQVFQ